MGNAPTTSNAPGANSLPPKIGDIVTTQFGPGRVEDYREDDNVFVVQLRWQLAEGNRAYAYLQGDSLFRKPKADDAAQDLFVPGTLVETPQGRASVAFYRVRDGMYAVEYNNWLTEGQVARGFLHPSSVKRQIRAKKGQYVYTVYGTGVMLGVRKDGTHVVKVKQLEGGAVAFLQADSVVRVIKACVSSIVQTSYGVGTVIGYRDTEATDSEEERGIYLVQLDYALAFVNADCVKGVIAREASVWAPTSPNTSGSRDRQASCTVS